MVNVLLRNTHTFSGGNDDAPFSMEELKAMHAAARAADRLVRSLARMKVARIYPGSNATLLEIESLERRKKNSAQTHLNAELQQKALDLNDLFDVMEQRAIEVAAQNDKRPDVESDGHAPIATTSLKYALEPIDAANLALSRVQNFVTPVLTNADGSNRELRLPPSAALVPPRKMDKSPTRPGGISGLLTGQHGMNDENVIIDDRASVLYGSGKVFKKGDLVTCKDDLIQYGKPIVRYRLQKRIPECG
ncbi:MAG: hypothetical protein ACT4QA_19655 [Panacagrimonas sp.]